MRTYMLEFPEHLTKTVDLTAWKLLLIEIKAHIGSCHFRCFFCPCKKSLQIPLLVSDRVDV